MSNANMNGNHEQGVREKKTVRVPRHRDMQQVDGGCYWVKQNGVTVGELLVEETSNPMRKIEHWGLYGSYDEPDAIGTNTPLEIVAKTSCGSVTDFRLSLAERKRTVDPGLRYIQADCIEQAP
jgi:hypothetical protein